MEENKNLYMETQEHQTAEDTTGKKKNDPVETKRKLKFQSPVTWAYVPKKKKGKKSEKTEEDQKPEENTGDEKPKRSVWKRIKNALEVTVLVGGVGLAAYGKYSMDKAKATADKDAAQEIAEFKAPDPAEANPEPSESTEEE